VEVAHKVLQAVPHSNFDQLDKNTAVRGKKVTPKVFHHFLNRLGSGHSFLGDAGDLKLDVPLNG